jgi:AhpD family alkylhydroperoxidase
MTGEGTSMNHPERYQHQRGLLRRLGTEVPGPMAGFSRLHHDALAAGALSSSVKELMAIVAGICTHCDDCVTYHMRGALLAGATREEVLEAIGVAILMGGGPAVMYATHALEALDQFEAERGAGSGAGTGQ